MELPAFLETRNKVKMLAIMEQWEESSGYRVDNTVKYMLLMLSKSMMDMTIFYLCQKKPYTSFFSMCSLSLILADLLMTVVMAALWVLGHERSLVSPCFVVAHASAILEALPLPMICVSILDYCIEDTWICHRSVSVKFLTNLVLMLVVWIFAVIYAFDTVNAEQFQLDNVKGMKSLVCEVQQSMLVSIFILGLFAAIVFAMLPFWSRIPEWVRQADRLHDLREEEESQRSDLFTSVPSTEAKGNNENYLAITDRPRPPLWFSLTLGFTIFWIPYLTVSVLCMAFGFGVPAYITINLLWFECANSLIVGVVFWVKSNFLGPYSHLPENICLWQVYWHLSKGRWQLHFPTAVFNPSKGERNSVFCV